MKSVQAVVAKMVLTAELHESGLALMRQRLEREKQGESSAAREVLFRRWLLRQ